MTGETLREDSYSLGVPEALKDVKKKKKKDTTSYFQYDSNPTLW